MLFSLFIFFGSKVGAQVGLETSKSGDVQIFLGGNATLHSSDEIFNAQIASQKIKIKNDRKSLLSIRTVGSKIIISNSKKSENFSEQIRIAKRKKTAEIKIFTDKKIKAALAKVKYDYRDIIQTHSSEHFVFYGGAQKLTFINPSPTQDFQKGISERQYLILIRSFNFLQEKKIFNYNSQSKKFGFSKVLSVRPPPVFC